MTDFILNGSTPRDVANEAELLVASLPQAAMSLALNLALPAAPAGGTDTAGGSGHDRAKWLEMELSRIAVARDHLNSHFLTAFEGTGGEVTEPLKSISDRLVSALGRIPAMVAKGSDAAEPDLALRCAEFARNDLASVVSEFLDAMFTQVVAYEKSTARLAKDVDANALTQIDTISRQINFIAVNASVEAARVGEAGKGFAVIASEIKALSEQSRVAVERIRTALG